MNQPVYAFVMRVCLIALQVADHAVAVNVSFRWLFFFLLNAVAYIGTETDSLPVENVGDYVIFSMPWLWMSPEQAAIKFIYWVSECQYSRARF